MSPELQLCPILNLLPYYYRIRIVFGTKISSCAKTTVIAIESIMAQRRMNVMEAMESILADDNGDDDDDFFFSGSDEEFVQDSDDEPFDDQSCNDIDVSIG